MTSKARRVGVLVSVLVAGFAMFAAPAIFFQMGNLGGFAGPNLAVVGLVQLALVSLVIRSGLRSLDLRWTDIGWSTDRIGRDALIGGAVAAGWAAVQFAWLIPATGGADRADIAGILAMTDSGWIDVAWYLPLGILGGGVAEELYNRGFLITVLGGLLGGRAVGMGVAGAFSALFFAAGHLPTGWVDWMDILVPSTAYVLLFLATRRLTAPIVAHAVWNTIAVAGIRIAYG